MTKLHSEYFAHELTRAAVFVKHVLSEHATFDDSTLSFDLHKPLTNGTRLGTCHLVTKNKDVQNSEKF